MTANAGSVAVPLRHGLPGALERQRQRGVGQRRQVIGEPLDRQPAVEVGHEQTEHLRVVHIAQQVHLLFLVAVRLGELGAHAAQPRPIQSGVCSLSNSLDPLVEQFVEQDWMPDQVVGGPAAGREQPHHALERRRKLVQQRNVGAATGDHVDQLREARKEFVRPDVVRRAGPARALRGTHCSPDCEQSLDPRARRRLVTWTRRDASTPRSRCAVAAGSAKSDDFAGARVSASSTWVRSARRARAATSALRGGFDEHRVERCQRRHHAPREYRSDSAIHARIATHEQQRDACARVRGPWAAVCVWASSTYCSACSRSRRNS